MSQAVEEADAVLVVEHVEEAAVEDGVELLPEGPELTNVADEEASGDSPLRGLDLGEPDGGRGDVDPRRLATGGGRHEDVLAGPAAHVEHPAP
jgi:hypothetical protein